MHFLQRMGILDKSKPDNSFDCQVANGALQHQVTQGASFLSGIKQRLLSFIFGKIWNEEADPTLVGFYNLCSYLLPACWNLTMC